ncbi:MAG: leucine-rich repeat domain-containing protein [Oscillospiraceae bacterium]|nr:leucine-rich repeat domain-containing protein [Oscillospiraceae bacterium]
MKKNFLKVVSAFLVLAILVGLAPINAFAQNSGGTAAANTDDYELEATNSLGTLLTNAIDENMQSETSGENYISDVVFEGNTAQVTLGAVIDCRLAVAIYDESTQQMLASGNSDITAGDETAEVTLDIEVLPEYFIVKAFLLDSELNAQCNSYTSYDYTARFEEFLAATIYDFDEDLVISLDEAEDNNFMVLKENAVTVDAGIDENILLSADEENGVYQFGSASDEIQSLEAGDIFYYSDPEDIEKLVIIKVDTADVSGDTVTLTSAPAEISDIFDYIKIDIDAEPNSFEVDESNVGEGVEYLGRGGRQDDSISNATYARSDESIIDSYQFLLNFPPEKPDDGSQFYGQLSASGNLDITDAHFEIQHDMIRFGDDYLNISLKLESILYVRGTITGKFKNEATLFPLWFNPVPGVTIGLEPKLFVEVEVMLNFDVTLGTIAGASYNTYGGFTNLCEKPKLINAKVEVEGSIYIGLKLEPFVDFISRKFARFSFEGSAGEKYTAKRKKDTPDVRHDCTLCLEGEVFISANIKAKLVLLEGTKAELRFEYDIFSVDKKVADYYYSVDHDEFSLLETCPYNSYRVTFRVKDENGNPIQGAYLNTVPDDVYLSHTDENGESTNFFKNGTYNYDVTVIGYYRIDNLGNTVVVDDEAQTLDLVFRPWGDENPTDPTDPTNPTDPTDPEYVPPTGVCGENGDNVTWTLQENGELVIAGSGNMANFEYSAPWYSYHSSIKSVTIQSGVTSIGKNVFRYCSSLESVTIPNGITSIGESAFYYCSSLTNIVIPNSVTSIGNLAFLNCTSITSIVSL